RSFDVHAASTAWTSAPVTTSSSLIACSRPGNLARRRSPARAGRRRRRHGLRRTPAACNGSSAIASSSTSSELLVSPRLQQPDSKPDPREPKLAHTIEADELASKAGYSRPHTVHCGPGGIFLSALGGANGADGPGGVALIDHDTFEVTGPWESDRGDQHFGYDIWWHLNEDVAVTSEWATPSMFENGLNPEDLLARRFGHHLNFWSLSEG